MCINLIKGNAMTNKIDVNDFTSEKECIYEGERYSVRDNGALFRHSRIGMRVRQNDNKWTFGKENSQNPYLHLVNVRIHRIVATAFHGEPSDPLYVVDHIDTNCRNNRPENLRWLTRLENALKNPVTRKRIELFCGSIEAFLENPSILHGLKGEPNFAWMRTVTPEEARNCKERMYLWAASDKKPSGGSLGEWVYEPIKGRERIGQQVTHPKFGDGMVLQQEGSGDFKRFQIKFASGVKWVLANYVQPNFSEKNGEEVELDATLTTEGSANKQFIGNALDIPVHGPINTLEMLGREPELVMALTKRCAQRMWRVPSYFPCCPEEVGINPLEAYFQNLKVGAVFSKNDVYPESAILEFVKIKDDSSILVMCEKKEGLKPWSLAEITFENDLFVHTSLHSFFGKDGADKVFCLKQGLEWTGGDTFDDFC